MSPQCRLAEFPVQVHDLIRLIVPLASARRRAAGRRIIEILKSPVSKLNCPHCINNKGKLTECLLMQPVQSLVVQKPVDLGLLLDSGVLGYQL